MIPSGLDIAKFSRVKHARSTLCALSTCQPQRAKKAPRRVACLGAQARQSGGPRMGLKHLVKGLRHALPHDRRRDIGKVNLPGRCKGHEPDHLIALGQDRDPDLQAVQPRSHRPGLDKTRRPSPALCGVIKPRRSLRNRRLKHLHHFGGIARLIGANAEIRGAWGECWIFGAHDRNPFLAAPYRPTFSRHLQ